VYRAASGPERRAGRRVAFYFEPARDGRRAHFIGDVPDRDRGREPEDHVESADALSNRATAGAECQLREKTFRTQTVRVAPDESVQPAGDGGTGKHIHDGRLAPEDK